MRRPEVPVLPEDARPADAPVLPEVAEGFLDRPRPGGLQGALEARATGSGAAPGRSPASYLEPAPSFPSSRRTRCSRFRTVSTAVPRLMMWYLSKTIFVRPSWARTRLPHVHGNGSRGAPCRNIHRGSLASGPRRCTPPSRASGRRRVSDTGATWPRLFHPHPAAAAPGAPSRAGPGRPRVPQVPRLVPTRNPGGPADVAFLQGSPSVQTAG